ncbi:hemerythrin domain-containing protein [Glycomyces algeriensis]|nr:hemerythrin domain-containing protein [Glycomyces algeriensis]MDA1368307.1 hemerythrin domain-containing protein [Glycomyces algeriensis]MDR7351748.1 hemerythrin superfamily protein [Glycomyces algeriensis]
MSGDVVDLIMQDHREVERLFDKMRQFPDTRALAAPVLSALLIAHSRAEEAAVYPVAKDEAGDSEEVAHSQEEHTQAEQLLKRLVETDPDSAKFVEVLTELEDSITHHVKEEESTVLPHMKEHLSEQRRMELGEAFAASRAEHLGERPGEATKEELQWQAQNMGLTGTSSMGKAELAKKLKAKAG